MKTAKWMIPAVLAATLLMGCGADSTTEQNTDDNAGSAAAAASEQAEESVELHVFAAASMEETLTQLSDTYMEQNPNITIVLNLDSSGTLKTQIEEGADCDIFLSAAQKQMNQLDATQDAESNPDGLDFVDADTRFNILENKVVLVVPDDNPKDIQSFEDIAEKADLIALGNDDVPVGQYSEQILTNLGVLEQLEEQNKITYGSNVKEVATQVAEGVADCGIIYETDAYSEQLKYVDEADSDLCDPAIYPVAVLKTSKHSEEAEAFLKYLTTDEADKVFEEVGFKPIS